MVHYARRMAELRGVHRDALIRATVAEFAAAGYEGASLNRIIRAAGISKSSFYHAVASKAELFDAVVHALVDDVAAQWRVPDPSRFSDGRFWEQVDRTIADFGELAAHDPSLGLLGRIFYLPAAGATEARAALMNAVRDWVEKVLRQGVATGDVRADLPVDLLASAAFAALRAVDEWALAAGPQTTDAARRAPGLLLRGLLQPSAR